MRIAYVVDVHGRFDTVRTALDEIGAVDVLVVGGDITTFGTPDDAERAIELWRPLAPRLLAVAGNCDSREIDTRLLELGVSIAGRGVTVGEVAFYGVSAAPHSPLHTPYEVPDEMLLEQAEAGLAEIADARLSVFCPHAPPYRTRCDRLWSGAHVGSPALREFIVREQPDLVLCGHIHEARAEDAIERSRIVNPGPISDGSYALATIDDGALEVTLG
jgi:hypothetical protein